ncbi:MAG: hypothetical protein R2795_05435 [Saprospiraceae bacterium]
MGYQSRQRNYRSPREKNAIVRRNTGLILLFGAAILAIWLFKHRYYYWGWLKTYIYY